MNIAQAKSVPLPEFLARLGYLPTHTRGNALWYCSPLRNEKTPSFKIDHPRNIWFDHGQGVGGTVIELMAHIDGHNDTRALLARIAEISAGVLDPALSNRLANAEPRMIEQASSTIVRVGEIVDSRLIHYLQRERAIPIDLARLYLKELEYRVGERQYTALGFANRAGGYELRNAVFKGSIGKKDLSVFENPARNDLVAFEGAYDFLSALAYHGQERPQSNVLVLNSTAMIERAADYIQSNPNIERVSTYFDHDSAGAMARERMVKLAASLAKPFTHHDRARLYEGYKDFNDMWQQTRPASPSYPL
jgi:hypothetical protein